MIALQEHIALEQNRRWIGRSVEILVEGPARRPPGHVAGKTPQFTTAIVNATAAPGSIVTGTVVAATGHTMIAVASEGCEFTSRPEGHRSLGRDSAQAQGAEMD